MKESGVVQCLWLEDLQHSIGEARESQGGGEETGGIEGQSGARNSRERTEGKDTERADRG